MYRISQYRNHQNDQQRNSEYVFQNLTDRSSQRLEDYCMRKSIYEISSLKEDVWGRGFWLRTRVSGFAFLGLSIAGGGFLLILAHYAVAKMVPGVHPSFARIAGRSVAIRCIAQHTVHSRICHAGMRRPTRRRNQMAATLRDGIKSPVIRLDMANDCCKIGNKLPQPLLPAKAADQDRFNSAHYLWCRQIQGQTKIPLHYVDDENRIIP